VNTQQIADLAIHEENTTNQFLLQRVSSWLGGLMRKLVNLH